MLLSLLKKTNMETTKLLSASLIDIVFDGRNKNYGAYELRKNYNKRMFKALFIGLLIFSLLFYGFTFLQTTKSVDTILQIDDEWVFTSVDLPKPKTSELYNHNKKKHTSNRTNNKNNAGGVIEFQDEILIKEPSITDFQPTDFVAGPGLIGGDDFSSEPGGNGLGAQTTVDIPDSSNLIYKDVQEPASFPGGLKAWRKYLTNAVDIDKPIREGAQPGTYTVVVSFVVNTNGTIEQVAATSEHGFRMEEEAMRVVNKGPKWLPAKHNGVAVRTYCRQPITFQIAE